MNLRKTAKGQPCLVRIPTVCNGDSSTTVLAHVRMAGISGIGIKSPDLFAAFACFACHSALDFGCKAWPRPDLMRMHLEGCIRTQNYWLRQGYIHVGKGLEENT